MGFQSLKDKGRRRTGGGFSRNIALAVDRFEGETVFGTDLETGENIQLVLSETRTYVSKKGKARNPLSVYAEGRGQIKQVEKGGVMFFSQVFEENGVLAARDVKTVKASPSDNVVVFIGDPARVDRPRQYNKNGPWSQKVLVLLPEKAVVVGDAAAAKAAAETALTLDLPGKKSFVLRGFSEEDGVLAVRFSARQEELESGDYRPLSMEEIWAEFLTAELSVSGQVDEEGHAFKLTGQDVLDHIGDGVWEIIPALEAAYGPDTVAGFVEHNRDPSLFYRFDRNREKGATGFCRSLVAIGVKGDSYFINAAMTLGSQDKTVYPMASIQTANVQPPAPSNQVSQPGQGAPSGAGASGWDPPDDLDDEVPF